LNGLDLFSGIGGLSLALRDYVQTIAFCECNTYCQAVLLSRMASHDLSRAQIWDNVATLKGKQFKGIVDIIFGGFPCQNISTCGDGKGLAGERSGLFFEIMRLVGEIQPTFVFLENVPAIRTRGLDIVLKEFTCAGYDCRWTMLSASDVGAKHIRERWFLLAYSNSDRHKKTRFTSGQKAECAMPDHKIEHASWNNEPENKLELDGMANGIPNRMDRIRALGNSVVPAQAKEAFEKLMGLKK
jgi:DNA (cytosine-5)-methyltransferase 1